MVDGYRILKNRLLHNDVICPQNADAAHLAFWERIQQLESKAAALYTLAERTCGDGCHCMKENDEKCALLENDK